MILTWIKNHFKKKHQERARRFLPRMSISKILEFAENADKLHDGVAEEYLKEIHRRKDNFDFEIIKTKDPSNHSCNAIDLSIVCFEREDGLWVKEYRSGLTRVDGVGYREGRTYQVKYCPWCGYTCN